MTRWLVPARAPVAGLAAAAAAPEAGRPLGGPPGALLARSRRRRSSASCSAYLAGEAARRLDDARLFLVSLAFMTSAGFLGLHALATPGVLLENRTRASSSRRRSASLIASGFAAASALDLRPRPRRRSCGASGCSAGPSSGCSPLWAVYSVAELPPLDRAAACREDDGPLLRRSPRSGCRCTASPRCALRRALPAPALADARRGVAAAFILLAEAMIAIAFGRNWHASWWEWHVLMAVAFGLVAARRAGRVRAPALRGRRLQATSTSSTPRSGSTAATHAALGPSSRSTTRTRTLGERERAQRGRGAAARAGRHELRRLDELFRPYLSPQLPARLAQSPRPRSSAASSAR